MRRDIRDFYDLKRQRVRRRWTERDDKLINEMKKSHMAQQPSALQGRNLSYSSSLAYLDISVSVFAIFASKDKRGFNASSHALLA